MRSEAALAELGRVRVASGVWVCLEGVVVGAWCLRLEGVANEPVFAGSAAAVAGSSLEGVRCGESRSKRPSTRPFFCGVGPIMVRTGFGVRWLAGRWCKSSAARGAWAMGDRGRRC